MYSWYNSNFFEVKLKGGKDIGTFFYKRPVSFNFVLLTDFIKLCTYRHVVYVPK